MPEIRAITITPSLNLSSCKCFLNAVNWFSKMEYHYGDLSIDSN
jgi:hypothetical protein